MLLPPTPTEPPPGGPVQPAVTAGWSASLPLSICDAVKAVDISDDELAVGGRSFKESAEEEGGLRINGPEPPVGAK
jgi:hypothetical protein